MARSTKSLTVTVTSSGPVNLPPVWTYTDVSFTQGVADFRVAAVLVSDATGPVAISMTGTGSSGVTWDNVLKRWVYDGVGVAGTSSWSGSASDGVNPPVAATITVRVLALSSSVIQWSMTPKTGLPNIAKTTAIGLPIRTKHVRWVRCPDNNKWYLFGGDYPTSGLLMTTESGVNITMSFDPTQPVASAFAFEYPFCGKPGQSFAPHGDEIAVCWDSIRHVFWVTDGYQGGGDACVFDGVTNGIPKEKIVFQFNPATQNWIEPFPGRLHYSAQTGGGQHMRTVHDPVRDLIYGPCLQAAYTVFNCTTGVWQARRNMTGIAAGAYVSTGQTVHLVGDYMYWMGGAAAGGVIARSLYETNVTNNVSRTVAVLPYQMYDDQDYSYIPSIDSFLVGVVEPNYYTYVIHRVTGAISDGPPLPLKGDNTQYRVMHNNYDPTINACVIGWTMSTQAFETSFPKNEYWEYRIDPIPAWLPTPGNVKEITTDIYGIAVNSYFDVKPTDYGGTAPYFGTSSVGVTSETRAWASAAYARDFSSNGAILLSCGGDGDYWGTEVYAFDLTSRRWSRLNEPHRNMGGGTNGKIDDPLRAPTDPLYFSTFECEHGPSIAADVLGLLPTTPNPTTPAVPHTYDGLTWIPGSIVGNRKGALLRPISSIMYTTRSTSRAHYFDLDANRWGRFSDRLASFSAATPTCAKDDSLGRIYHNYGYLDLATRHQVARTWGGIPYSTSGDFDANRRLWVHPTNNGTAADTNPGGMVAIPVDSSSTAVSLNLVDASGSTRWLRHFGYCAGMLWCPDLDCFFFYNSGTTNFGYQRQKLWKISPPSSSPLTNAWQVTEITMPGDTVTGDAQGIGNFKRFLWISSIKCIAIINGPASGHVFLYKPEGI